MKKAVHIAASPNTQKDDVKLAWKLWTRPWSWKGSRGGKELQEKISDYFETENVCMFDSGRSAIMEVLRAFGIGPGDEVLVHAFTCLVVANPVKWVGAKPVYVDVNPENLNFDLQDLKNKITGRTKAIIIQHTFGIPEDVQEIRKITGDKIIIIEDLAHSLGGEFKGQKLGTFGDAVILTFGIEKVVSSVRGGAAVIYNGEAANKMKIEHDNLPEFPRSMIGISLFNPVFWSLTLPVYYFGIGKLTLGRAFVFIGHKIGILGRMIEKSEYQGSRPDWMPSKIAPVLAALGSLQWDKLGKTIMHRREIAKIYSEKLGINYENSTMLLRFPVLVKDRDSILKKTKKAGIVLGDWYKKILYAPLSTLEILGYKAGSCPNAERIKDEIINLPTHINVTAGDAEKIASLVKPFLN